MRLRGASLRNTSSIMCLCFRDLQIWVFLSISAEVNFLIQQTYTHHLYIHSLKHTHTVLVAETQSFIVQVWTHSPVKACMQLKTPSWTWVGCLCATERLNIIFWKITTSLNISGTNKQKVERSEKVDFIVNAKNTKKFEEKRFK